MVVILKTHEKTANKAFNIVQRQALHFTFEISNLIYVNCKAWICSLDD